MNTEEAIEPLESQKPSAFWQTVRRALRLRCPNCGKGHLFKSYLKPVEQCEVCHEHFGHIRADDGPAWLTILVVGHILAPLLLIIVPGCTWPDWLSLTAWLSLAFILSLVLLPRSKALFIAMIWRSQCAGAEK